MKNTDRKTGTFSQLRHEKNVRGRSTQAQEDPTKITLHTKVHQLD